MYYGGIDIAMKSFYLYQRLSKDYETLTDRKENVIYLAMIYIMDRRLKPDVI